jgi:hypothetical protein
MAVNPGVIERTKKCRLKLIELAQIGRRMTYQDMRTRLGLTPRAPLGNYLNRIYDCEVRCFGRPDITLILHDGSRLGRFNSRGRPAQSDPVVRNDPTHVKAYKRELRRVYACWGGEPRGADKRWLESKP